MRGRSRYRQLLMMKCVSVTMDKLPTHKHTTPAAQAPLELLLLLLLVLPVPSTHTSKRSYVLSTVNSAQHGRVIYVDRAHVSIRFRYLRVTHKIDA